MKLITVQIGLAAAVLSALSVLAITFAGQDLTPANQSPPADKAKLDPPPANGLLPADKAKLETRRRANAKLKETWSAFLKDRPKAAASAATASRKSCRKTSSWRPAAARRR